MLEAIAALNRIEALEERFEKEIKELLARIEKLEEAAP